MREETKRVWITEPDGKEFTVYSEAVLHERSTTLEAEVDEHLNGIKDSTERSRAIAKGHIMRWLEEDVTRRPWRYAPGGPVIEHPAIEANQHESIEDEAITQLAETSK